MRAITNFFVKIVNRWLPDAFLFAVILTLVVFVLSLIFTDNSVIDMVVYWGNDAGFWGLLSFSMQMIMVVVLGTAFASAPIVKKILRAIANIANSNKSAILLVTFVSGLCCWLNWGFGLVAGALLAREIARKVPTVDYRLLIASAYSGFVIWHAGLSGSIPLTISSETTVGGVTFSVPISDTIFHPANLGMVIAILVLMPFLNWMMHPDKEHTVCVDTSLLVDEEERTYDIKVPADRIEHSKILWILTLVLGFAYIVYYFMTSGFNLGLNIVNMIFMFVGILAHGDLRRYVDAIGDASTTAAGIILQFPFYAGIMGMMVGADENGVSLAGVITNAMMSISTDLPHDHLPERRYRQLLRSFRRRPVGRPGPRRYACCRADGHRVRPCSHGYCLGRPVDQHDPALLGSACSGYCRPARPRHHGLPGHRHHFRRYRRLHRRRRKARRRRRARRRGRILIFSLYVHRL